MSCDCNTLVIGEAGVQGPQGLAGINGTNGTNGINAFTTVAETFVQPGLNDEITFVVVQNSWMAVGQTVYISQAGFYSVISLGGTTQVNATLIRTDGVVEGEDVVSGLKVAPSASATYSDPLSELNVNGPSSLNGNILVNDSQASVNFQVNGDTQENVLFVNGAQNSVGILTPSPTTSLDVNGTMKVRSGAEFLVGSTFNSNQADADFVIKTQGSANTFYVDASTNKIGIKKSNPAGELDVNGETRTVSLLVNPSATGNTSVLKVLGASSAVPLNVDSTNNRVGIKTITPTVELDVVGAAKVSGDVTIGSNVLKVNSTGTFVGINKSAPTVPLDVVGNAAVSGDLSIGGASTLTTIGATSLYLSEGASINTTLSVTGASTLSSLGVTGSATVGNNFTVDGSTFKVDSANNFVGIRTATPGNELEVVGSVKASDYRVATGSGAAKLVGFFFGNGGGKTLNGTSGLKANLSNTFTDTVTGCLVGDFVIGSYATIPGTTNFTTDIVFSCKVTATDTVTVTYTNTDASGTDTGYTNTVTLNYLVIRATAS
jgi:hypothetical protein